MSELIDQVSEALEQNSLPPTVHSPAPSEGDQHTQSARSELDSDDESHHIEESERGDLSTSGKPKGRVKGPWSREEDDLLASLVAEYGPKKWSMIAEKVPGRIGKQCRERWLNHLDNSVKKTPWTEEEDNILMETQRRIGNRWCEIARMLPGRPENAVKNRFNSLTSKGKVPIESRSRSPESVMDIAEPQLSPVGTAVPSEDIDRLSPKGAADKRNGSSKPLTLTTTTSSTTTSSKEDPVVCAARELSPARPTITNDHIYIEDTLVKHSPQPTRANILVLNADWSEECFYSPGIARRAVRVMQTQSEVTIPLKKALSLKQRLDHSASEESLMTIKKKHRISH